MPGQHQDNAIRDAFRLGILTPPADRFKPTGGAKVECVLCGQAGYGPVRPDHLTALPWQLAHMMPHAYRCACGAAFTAPWGLARHIIPQRKPARDADRALHHWVAPADPDPEGVP
jgi:hypothetical protein